MSTQALSQTQKDQLRQMLDECGLKNVHLEIGDILKEGLDETTKGIPVEELTEILVTAGFTLDYKKEGKEMGLAGEVEPFVMIKAYA